LVGVAGVEPGSGGPQTRAVPGFAGGGAVVGTTGGTKAVEWSPGALIERMAAAARALLAIEPRPPLPIVLRGDLEQLLGSR
jgi:hypothetical protein